RGRHSSKTLNEVVTVRVTEVSDKAKNFQSWHVMRDRRRNQYIRAALVGLVAGGVALLFQQLLVLAEHARHEGFAYLQASHPYAGLLCAVTIGGLCGLFVGWLTARFA